MSIHKKIQLGVLVSHPIQYFVPVYQCLSKVDEVDLNVIYLTRMGTDEYYDDGFGQAVKWDIPMLDGYKHQFLSNQNKLKYIEWNVVKAIFRNRFDVLLMHGYNSLTNLLAILLARLVGTKVLMRGDTRLQKHHKYLSPKAIFKRFVFKFCNGFLTIGSLNGIYYSKHGVPPQRIFFAPFCVQNAQFYVSPQERVEYRREVLNRLNLSMDSSIVLFASKLVKRKRADDMIRAFALICKDFPNSCLVIAGSGGEEENLRHLADSLGVRQIRFLGFQNQTQLPSLYAASDFFVLPADSEPWGLVINEVMAAGVPVILSSQVGAAPDLVEGKSTGIIYPCGDVNALSQAMRSLLEQPVLREQMAENALTLIRKWDVSECVKGILKAVKSVSLDID